MVDEDISSSTVELRSPNVSTTSITCPASPSQSLGVKLPFLVLVLKNLGDYFTFEVAVLDHTKVKRRFRASNFQVRRGWGKWGFWGALLRRWRVMTVGVA